MNLTGREYINQNKYQFHDMLIVFAVSCLLARLGACHSYMSTPAPRVADLCIPVYSDSNCCAPKPVVVTSTYTRGQVIDTVWARNNHIGGFVKFSIVPMSQSDVPGVFDLTASAFQYNCFGTDCVGSNGDFFGGDPDGTAEYGLPCSMKVQIPQWLPDGEYTLQWRWFSGGDSYDIRNLGLIDFVSCHDFRVLGGDFRPKPDCPLFVGGDASDPTKNACEFFKSNDVNACLDERNCISWFAKAPPQPIMSCPSNILKGGVLNGLAGNFSARDSPTTLFVGPTDHPEQNPGTESVDLDAIRAQLDVPTEDVVVPPPKKCRHRKRPANLN